MKTISIRFLIVWMPVFFGGQISFSQSPVPSGAVVEQLHTDFLQPEGPVWKDGTGLLFSDIQANKIYCWSPVDSALTEYLNPSDSSNGLTFDLQGRLILTQMAKRRVSRQELNGDITPLASTYNGKKFNSPNDLIVKSDGSVFFTDPDFNTPAGQLKELSFQGVFRISPYGVVYVLDSTTFNNPNGICFSPDESKLYVDESMPNLRTIYRWDVLNDSTISNRQPFFHIPTSGYLDGMKVDASGNLYCTGPTGIWVISPTGVCLDTIVMPETPSNCAWGDADRNTLYITAGSSLYRVRMVTTDIENDLIRQSPYKFELLQNYPNPFNPSTTILYELPAKARISVKILDLLGREIATLVDEVKVKGSYSVQFNAGSLSSGTYFCRLQADNSVAINKLMLVK